VHSYINALKVSISIRLSDGFSPAHEVKGQVARNNDIGLICVECYAN